MSRQEMLNGAAGTIIEKRAKAHRGLPELSEVIYTNMGMCATRGDYAQMGRMTPEINIVGPFGQKKFTVKTYHGQNGKKEWRRDFLRCSRDWHGGVPLFGYNKSSALSLIFYGGMGLFPELC
ncbi:hypothetical protein L218DRAFT_1007594 [Marasmius fiardii PR-910]|nr:hypothetical protein L218DRAFT_1007594 [Marasmius fiardii PR-910]